jgi:hypothetical protein
VTADPRTVVRDAASAVDSALEQYERDAAEADQPLGYRAGVADARAVAAEALYRAELDAPGPGGRPFLVVERVTRPIPTAPRVPWIELTGALNLGLGDLVAAGVTLRAQGDDAVAAVELAMMDAERVSLDGRPVDLARLSGLGYDAVTLVGRAER